MSRRPPGRSRLLRPFAPVRRLLDHVTYRRIYSDADRASRLLDGAQRLGRADRVGECCLDTEPVATQESRPHSSASSIRARDRGESSSAPKYSRS